MTYSEKLKDPRWQRKRLEVMERHEFTCQHCDSKSKTLNVHHVNYEKGKAPWDYDDENFVTLCDGCHSMVERRIKCLRAVLAWDKDTSDHLMTFCSARREEGPFNQYAREFAVFCAEALSCAESAILDFVEDGTEASFQRDHARSKAAMAVWCLEQYVDHEIYRLKVRESRGG
jgi:hypothetical protein